MCANAGARTLRLMADTLIVALDLEAPTRAHDAASLATWLADATDCDVVATTIFAPHPGPLAPQLEHQRRGLTALFGRPVETLAIAGTSPARLLHELADQRRPRAIVIGSSRSGPPGVVSLGSVGELLLHGSSAAIVVAPADLQPPKAKPATIGVAFGGTPEAEEAVRHATELARRMHAHLRILTVAEPPAHDALEGYRVEDALDRALAGAPAERIVLSGDPAIALAAAAADVDLLIAGSRSYGPLGAVLLGAVTRRLVRAAPCPTMLVPRLRDPALAVALIGGMESVVDT